MCGLVGIISRKMGGLFHSDLGLMEHLLLLDQIRGDDSTGVFTVMRDSNVTVTKVGSHPAHLFATAAWGKLRTKAINSGRIIIGHNRKATTGAINSANAHPFHEENIILVHNGTMRGGHKKLADVEVDSHAICHSFAANGAEETIKTLDAAFAFIWWDVDKNKLFAVRNEERPLHIVTTEDLHILCSESWMPKALLHRASKKVESVTEIKAGELYEFSLDGTFKTSTIELRKPTVYVYDHSRDGSMHQGNWNRQRDARDAFADMEDDNVVKMIGTRANTTSSNGTGTQVTKDHTQTPFEKAANEIVNRPHPLPTSPFTTNVHYAKGESVLLKITKAEHEGSNKKLKVSGWSTEPGKPQIDFVGYLEADATEDYVKDLMAGEAMGYIISFARSTCGDSMWVRDLEKASVVQVHNTDIAVKTWKYVVKHVKCSTCAGTIHDCESEFTTVTKSKANDPRVVCADCIENKLPEGDIRNVFTQRRLTALQAREPVGNSPAIGTVNLDKPNNPPTVH